MKALEEMSLVDDFLMNSLTGHKVYGEAASRYILECIFQRRVGELTVVPQRFFCGEGPEEHGVRLDVYLDGNSSAINIRSCGQRAGTQGSSRGYLCAERPLHEIKGELQRSVGCEAAAFMNAEG